MRLFLALALVGCGGAAAEPASSDNAGDEAPEGDGEAEVLLVGALPASPPDDGDASSEELVPRPAGRTEDDEAPRFPELAEADRLAATALGLPLGVASSSGLDAAIAELRTQLGAEIEALRAASNAYAAIAGDSERPPSLRAVAIVRSADLHDAVAARLETFVFGVPDDLAADLAEAAEDVRAEVALQVRERVHTALAPEAATLYCMALEGYRAAIRDAPPGSWAGERAEGQIEAYGDEFARHCDAE